MGLARIVVRIWNRFGESICMAGERFSQSSKAEISVLVLQEWQWKGGKELFREVLGSRLNSREAGQLAQRPSGPAMWDQWHRAPCLLLDGLQGRLWHSKQDIANPCVELDDAADLFWEALQSYGWGRGSFQSSTLALVSALRHLLLEALVP